MRGVFVRKLDATSLLGVHHFTGSIRAGLLADHSANRLAALAAIDRRFVVAVNLRRRACARRNRVVHFRCIEGPTHADDHANDLHRCANDCQSPSFSKLHARASQSLSRHGFTVPPAAACGAGSRNGWPPSSQNWPESRSCAACPPAAGPRRSPCWCGASSARIPANPG